MGSGIGQPAGRDQHERLPTLDGLRGIAIMLVLAYHLGPSQHLYPQWLKPLTLVTGLGWSGVDLFFVLSGFLITGILLDAKGSPHYFRNFYVRRILRIFPLYYGVLLCFFAVYRSMGDWSYPREFAWYATYGTNLFYLIHPTWSLSLGHFWSLAVEEHFYMAWPTVVLLVSRRTLYAVCLVGIASVVAMRVAMIMADRETFAIYVLTPFRADALMVGAYCSLLARSERILPHLRKVSLSLIVSAGIAWGLCIKGWRYHAMNSVGYTAVALFWAGWLMLALSPPRFYLAMLSGTAIRRVGTYSYGIYVLHPIVVMAGERWFVATGRLLPALIYGVGIGAISFVLAAISFHLYETPFNRLKRLFPQDGRLIVDHDDRASRVLKRTQVD